MPSAIATARPRLTARTVAALARQARRRLAGLAIPDLLYRCWKHAGRGRPKFLLFIGLSSLAHVALLAKPLFFGKSFDALQQGGPQLLSQMAWWLMLYGLMELVFWLLHGPARILERNVAFGIRRRFFAFHYQKLRQLPLRWHQERHSGDTINRLRKATDGLFDFAQSLFGLIGCVFGLFGPLVMLLVLSWKVALVAVAVNGFTFWMLRHFDRRIMRAIHLENESESRFASALYDYLGNITTVITLRLGLRTEEELRARQREMYQRFKPHVRLNEAKYFVLNLAVNGLEVGVILLYVWLELQATGTVMVGTAVAIFRYLNMLSGSYFALAGIYQNIQQKFVDLKMLDPLRKAEARLPPQVAPLSPHWQHVGITGLNFAHPSMPGTNAPRGGLKNVKLSLRRGQRIALVGESGSGKSTLLTLLRHLHDADQVRLDADGKIYTTLAPLADVTTLIPQEPEIFENSVAYNITLGLPGGAAEIKKAISMACFDPVLDRLPHGLETDLREKGLNLSGGEKQRLALARGLYAANESSLLLLDEPTSSVDGRTETEIYTRIFAAFPEKTIISSIHRLHLLPLFDTVVVMDGGKIVQTGPLTEVSRYPPFKAQWSKYRRISRGKV